MNKEVKFKLIKIGAIVITNLIAIGAIKYGYLMSPDEREMLNVALVSVLTGMF